MTDHTMTSDHTDNRDPAEIEREIRRTQSDMSRTADRIGQQMTPRKLFDALLDTADDQGVDARYLIDQARRNPIALGMIALGGLWLISDSDARAKTFTGKLGGKSHPGKDERDNAWNASHHGGYVQHMSAVEPTAGEDQESYRRRRDCARASYLMIEQRPDEDESSFRQRLDEATDKLREQRDSMATTMRDWGDRAGQRTGEMSDSAARMYRQNPLVGGLIAAAVGAVAGAALPPTRTEEEYFGEYGAQALDKAKDKAGQAKDRMVDKADGAVAASGQSSGSGGSDQARRSSRPDGADGSRAASASRFETA